MEPIRFTKRRPRISDIAAEAGVGTATVDRVLHGRGGVSRKTERRVKDAIATLSSRRRRSARGPEARPKRIRLVLPANAGISTEFLAKEIRRIGAAKNAEVGAQFVEKMNPSALAEMLEPRRLSGYDGIAFQALDHPVVRDAAGRFNDSGVPQVCVMSGFDGLLPHQFVGTDNRAAGRTAGFLMGRMAVRAGKIAVIWGGALYRSHEDREIGFRNAIREDFPDFEILALTSGGDDDAGNFEQVSSALADNPDIVGVYSVGGGNEGVLRALAKRRVEREIVYVGHNLTTLTRRYLIDGVMDAVIHQDMRMAARMAMASLDAQLAGNAISLPRLPVEIVTKENSVGRI